MPVVAKLKHIRIAPRKVRLVADLIRGKSVGNAQSILNFTVRKASRPLAKLLKSAIANAKNNFQMEESDLRVSKIIVDEGPKYKRWMTKARGQASEIQKKTSHVTLVLDKFNRKEPEKSKKIKAETVRTEPEKKIEEKTEKVLKGEKPKMKIKRELIRPKIERGMNYSAASGGVSLRASSFGRGTRNICSEIKKTSCKEVISKPSFVAKFQNFERKL